MEAENAAQSDFADCSVVVCRRYLPFDVKLQRQAFAEMKADKLTFDGYTRVDTHPLEDPQFVAFSKN